MMDLIFENLLSNAVKYTQVGGTITVSASLDEVAKQVCIQVSNTGIGIPKTEAKHIFQSFFRASNAVNSQEMGSGLGLMLTRQLVQKLGGKLTLRARKARELLSWLYCLITEMLMFPFLPSQQVCRKLQIPPCLPMKE